MTKPRLVYFICTTPRSGSSFLCQVLSRTLLAGRPREYFAFQYTIGRENHPKPTLPGLIKTTFERGTTANGVFAAKLFWEHFCVLTNIIRQSSASRAECSTARLLSSVFPNLRYIWLTRRDKVRQAISLDRAVQTNIWNSQQAEFLISQTQPTFNFDRISLLHHQLLASEENWRNYFTVNGIEPFKLAFEDLINGYEEVTKAILKYLTIPVLESLSIGKPKHKKMADALTEEWIQKYMEIRQQCPEKNVGTHRHFAALLNDLESERRVEHYRHRKPALDQPRQKNCPR